MDVLVTALISAGAALLGGAITGWFARSAGVRQADATRQAANRQAEALLETVRMTLGQERAGQVLNSRREAYRGFLDSVDAVIAARRSGDGPRDARAALRRAFGAVQLEGPGAVVRAAESALECLRDSAGQGPDDQERAKREFIDAAQAALKPDQPG